MDGQRNFQRDPWWESKRDQAHGPLFETVKFLRDKQRSMYDRAWVDFALFSKFEASEMGAPRIRIDELRKPLLAMNVVRSCVNTVVSRIIQSKPKPTYITLGQSWEKQQAVKAVDAFAQGAMYHAKVSEVMPEAATHAAICGTGIVKTFLGRDNKPALEPVLVQELVIDRADGRRRNPRVIYHHRQVAKDALIRDYPKSQAAIETAACDPAQKLYLDDMTDQVTVCEAWRLPSGPDADDGRHVLCVDTASLLDEPWTRQAHPFVFMRWGKRTEGMWGYGIAEQLRALQYEINRLLLVMQEQMIFAGPKVFLQKGSNVNRDDITNKMWDIIEYTGQEPKYMTFQSVSPEMFQQLDRLYGRAFDEIGVSLQAARGEKPSGVTSGTAIRSTNDMQSGRLLGFGQEYENAHLMVADRFLEMGRDYAEADVEGDAEDDESSKARKKDMTFVYPTRQQGKRYLGKVSAADIKLARDEYVCQAYPTSALAQSPGDRMQQVTELQQGGTISPQEARYLLDFPDLERSNNIDLANYESVLMAVDQMLEHGQPLRPEPWTNLAVAIPLVGNALMRAQIDGAPESRWQLLAAYLVACQKMQAAQQPPAPPPGAAPPPGPGGPPAGGMPPGVG